MALPSGTALSTDTLKGYPVPIRAFVDANANGVFDAGRPSNFTVDRVFTGYLKVTKMVRIVDTDGVSVVQNYTATPTSTNLRPGRFLDYQITYANIATPAAGVGNVLLNAGSVAITEDGAASPNTWALDQDHNGVIDTSNVVGSAVDSGAQAAISFFSGLPAITPAIDQAGTTAATDVTKYLDTLSAPVAPGQVPDVHLPPQDQLTPPTKETQTDETTHSAPAHAAGGPRRPEQPCGPAVPAGGCPRRNPRRLCRPDPAAPVGPGALVTADAQGREQVFWKTLDNGGVKPGDVLRYTLAGENHGPLPVSGLILTQPIPVEATFLPHSITGSDQARVTYSVDRGRTFDAAPTVRVAGPGGTVKTLPAPPTAYTHVRWTLLDPVAPGASVRVACEVKVN